MLSVISPFKASPTFLQRQDYLELSEDFLYGYPGELHALHPRSLCYAFASEEQVPHSEQFLRKKTIPRPLLSLSAAHIPSLTASEEQCLAWASVERWLS